MGLLLSVIDQNFPPRAKWSVDDIPDLSNKVVIVTGANIGLGYETAKVLLSHGANVYLACRDEAKARAAMDDLEKATGKRGIFLHLDLASLDSVRKAAETFQSKEDRLNVLFNNAGVMAAPMDGLTKEGYDLQFGVNVLGHFYFTQLLLPSLRAGAQHSDDRVARIINTSSQTHVTGTLNLDTLKDGEQRRKMSRSQLYSQSAFGKIVMSHEMAKHYEQDKLVCIALHPGSLTTNLGRHINPIARALIHAVSHSPPEGALTQLWAGTAPEAVSLNGGYLIPWARIGKPHNGTKDPELGAKLWAWLERQCQDVDHDATK